MMRSPKPSLKAKPSPINPSSFIGDPSCEKLLAHTACPSSLI